MININYKKGYNTGYSVAGTNIANIIKEISSNVFENSNLTGGINVFVQIPPFKVNKSAYNIGFFYWETEGFPDEWVPYIMSLDEFWSPCDLVTDNLKKIGFRGKVVNVPTPIIQKCNNESIDFCYGNGLLREDTFKFYSIFQWNYRKGYDVLIRGYLEAFEEEDVVLIIKTNWNFSVRDDFVKLLKATKRDIGNKAFPKIFFSEEKCNYDDILRLHSNSDCFVLPHRGEGWGIPIHEALNSYNPVIVTKFGGITDYLSEDNSYIVDHKKVVTKNMNWTNLYDNKIWAEPDLNSLIEKMRDAFENKDSFYQKQLLSKGVARKLSYSVVKDIIYRRIRSLSESLRLV